MVERFPLWRRIEHGVGVITFVTLIVTGFPQKFEGSELAHLVTGWLGGIDGLRLAHRVAGLVFVAHAAFHLGVFAVKAARGKMRLELLPTVRDLENLRDNLLYFFGLRAAPPKMPKFDYRQKFEYIGMVMGGLVMVFSGLVLLFPVTTAQLLGGFVFPISLTLHTSEATLALLVLVVWHAYTAVLSPDVFPLDRSIVTGFMHVDELKARHTLEYEQLREAVGPEALDEPPS
jgi:cytochrome b subunit of formate dehydrogenase